MKINCPIIWDWGVRWKDWDAEIVDVAPQFAHLATFAVGLSPERHYGKWRVTNIETGHWVSNASTKRAAVEDAAEKLRKTTTNKLVARMLKAKRVIAAVSEFANDSPRSTLRHNEAK